MDILEKLIISKKGGNKEEISKKDVAKIYRKLESVNIEKVKMFLVQEFFFADSERTVFDYKKIVIFNILYTQQETTDDKDKANILFTLIEQANNHFGVIQSHSQGLLDILQALTYVPTIAVADVIN